MNARTARTFFATIIAIILVFIGDGLTILHANMSTLSQPVEYHISYNNAKSIALDQEPEATVIGEPIRITYAGTVAYEVTLDTGMVYIEAQTGRVLANTARGPVVCGTGEGS